MAQLPSPFSSDPKDFAAVVAMTTELLQEGKIRLRVSPPSNISYNVKSIDLEGAVVKHGIALSTARSILNEISLIASSTLRGAVEKFIDLLVERSSPESGPPFSKEEKIDFKSLIINKFELVETNLVTERVRRKFHAAKASKHDTLIGIRWEVVERKYDQHEGEKAGGPAALIRFEITSRPKVPAHAELEIFSTELLSLFGIDPSYRRNFLIEVDEDDLNDLIDTLNDAKLRLVQEKG
jgi:hypothetical protein